MSGNEFRVFDEEREPAIESKAAAGRFFVRDMTRTRQLIAAPDFSSL